MEVPRGFTRCDECEDGLDYPTPSFTESHPLPVPCPSCSGSGLRPTEKLREEAVDALGRVGPDEPIYAYSDAVLRKVAERLGGSDG